MLKSTLVAQAWACAGLYSQPSMNLHEEVNCDVKAIHYEIEIEISMMRWDEGVEREKLKGRKTHKIVQTSINMQQKLLLQLAVVSAAKLDWEGVCTVCGVNALCCAQGRKWTVSWVKRWRKKNKPNKSIIPHQWQQLLIGDVNICCCLDGGRRSENRRNILEASMNMTSMLECGVLFSSPLLSPLPTPIMPSTDEKGYEKDTHTFYTPLPTISSRRTTHPAPLSPLTVTLLFLFTISCLCPFHCPLSACTLFCTQWSYTLCY